MVQQYVRSPNGYSPLNWLPLDGSSLYESHTLHGTHPPTAPSILFRSIPFRSIDLVASDCMFMQSVLWVMQWL